MTCRTFRDNAVELARGILDPDVAATARGHADVCASCAGVLAAHLHVTETLAHLRCATAPAPAVERALLEAYHQRTASRSADRAPTMADASAVRWRLVTAAAVCVAVGTAVWLRTSDGRTPTSREPRSGVDVAETARTVAPSPTLRHQPEARVASALQSPVQREQAPRRRSRPGTTPTADGTIDHVVVATRFFPLDSPPADSTDAQLVRVAMPRESMLAFGLPLDEERLSGMVQAELLVGPDGCAHAIRFVR